MCSVRGRCDGPPRRALLLLLGLAVAGGAVAAPARAQDEGESSRFIQLMLVEGDSLEVRFAEPFCRDLLDKGVEPKAEVARDKVISGMVAVREGTPVAVKVVESEDNGRAGKPGKMVLSFESVTAADGATVPLNMVAPLEREGGGKSIILKIFTLFLVKGGEPCIGIQERFHPHIAETTAIYLKQP